MRDLLTDSLCKVIKDVPYNSFGKAILANGGTYNLQAFGGNCVLQARELTKELIARGLSQDDIRYTTAMERPHWVPLVRDGEHLWFVDPFLLCPEPIDVNSVRDNKDIELDAYPFWGKTTGLVRGTQVHGGMELRLFRPKPTGGRKRVLTYSFQFDSPLAVELPSNDYQLLATLEQNNLVYTAVHPDTSVTMIYVSSDNQDMHLFKVGKGPRFSAKDEPQKAHSLLTRIAEERGETHQQLMNFFEDGFKSYHEVRESISS